MRISESRIRRIIKEEASRLLREEEEAGFDGPGVGEDAVLNYEHNVREKSGEGIRVMLETISEILAGGDPPGVAQHYPGWNRDDFALLLVEVLMELGVTSAALKKAIEKL